MEKKSTTKRSRATGQKATKRSRATATEQKTTKRSRATSTGKKDTSASTPTPTQLCNYGHVISMNDPPSPGCFWCLQAENLKNEPIKPIKPKSEPKTEQKYPGVAPGFERLYELGLFTPGSHIAAMQAQGYVITRPGYCHAP